MATLNKIASSPTIEGLEKLAQKFFYSPNVTIKENYVYNSKGKINGFLVVKKGKSFLLITEP